MLTSGGFLSQNRVFVDLGLLREGHAPENIPRLHKNRGRVTVTGRLPTLKRLLLLRFHVCGGGGAAMFTAPAESLDSNLNH